MSMGCRGITGGLTFNNPDFAAHARAHGASGRHARSTDELVPALDKAFAAGGVHLISVPVDNSENARLFLDENDLPLRQGS